MTMVFREGLLNSALQKDLVAKDDNFELMVKEANRLQRKIYEKHSKEKAWLSSAAAPCAVCLQITQREFYHAVEDCRRLKRLAPNSSTAPSNYNSNKKEEQNQQTVLIVVELVICRMIAHMLLQRLQIAQ